ncbi:pentatricopeptide repeat-containing protein At4g39952, mitochondrial-like [Coffea arabica]|uniref:Pentatricopeptide repeat-containing protein At4g39952, mitochondrial-like n=1 Tax=Coffea arabica TaxID=13443 RepID=A0A6P6TGM2_COFAR|nr:pentatricopeptide repeat-containing protein At4g39952, mitochondrial-like [Coffea arabica]XP_027077627.1 pentatricopeptide repeat-containing protein At4g39952, mitochondrial-like [Coffea arabica]XP_027077628.1 pentatricopeptide repeat-containing protein At4g39952, mitochondrial-like [Coffea arabica]
MPKFKFSSLYNRFYSSSTSDIVSNYLNCRINSFLSSQFLDLKSLLKFHSYIITTGQRNNLFIASKLMSIYAALNHLESCTKIFSSTKCKDPFLWNSIIKAHFSNGNYLPALEFFHKMRFSGFSPDQFSIPMVVSACAELGLVQNGMKTHALVSKLNLFNGNSAVGSSFIYMYAKCGYMDDASLMFDEMLNKDVVAWTALVVGYVQNGESVKGLECVCDMLKIGGDDERPNFRTLEGGFQACGNLSALVEGRCLHGLSVKLGTDCSHAVQSSFLSMYCKCGSLEEAHRAFSEIVNLDLLSWTLMIGFYAKMESLDVCLHMFLEMLASGIYPDGILISCVLLAFSSSMRISQGKAFHGFILRRNYDTGQVVYHGLLSMYCKFGLSHLAEKLLERVHGTDTESWNLIVAGFCKSRLESKCIEMFRKMQHLEIEYNLNCLMSVISSCSRLEATLLGRSLHCHAIKSLACESVSVANSLIDMYGKSGNLNSARRIFSRTQKDTVTWNVLISSYAHNGYSSEALALFNQMVLEGTKPNTATLVTLLSACSQLASLEKGEQIHNYIEEVGFESSLSLDTALVDMYAKCGQLIKSREVFDLMNTKDVISYNVMISGYGVHGDVKSAIEIFEQMEQSNNRPNELTFLAIISACTHAGLVEEGKYLFNRMKEYSLRPTLKHYACLVDLLGRAGSLLEAEEVILSMPIPPDAGMWGALLSACKSHNDTEMGIRIAKHAIESDPDNDGYYVIISDLYSSIGLWEKVERVRDTMKERQVRKRVGWSAL